MYATRTLTVPLLALYSLLSLILLGLGGWLTYLGLGDWYYELNFPPFQPPPWLFTPAWIVVLTGLAISTWIVHRRVTEFPHSVGFGLLLYGAQCVLNAYWSLLFFTLQRPDMSLWSLFVLDGVVLGMVVVYWRVSRWGAVLLFPYIGWLGLSTAINGWIVMHNSFPITLPM